VNQPAPPPPSALHNITVLGALTVPVENNQQMQFVGPDGQMIQVVVDQEPQNPEPPPVLGSVLKLGFMSLIIVEYQKYIFFFLISYF
jgi:hypothetical protein